MNNLLAIGGLNPMELLLIIAVIVLLFGSSKIPQLMRGLGSGINEFKKGLREGDNADAAKPAEPPKPAEAKPAEVKPAEPEKK
jgi:sec-independent protein translocase protein TatA